MALTMGASAAHKSPFADSLRFSLSNKVAVARNSNMILASALGEAFPDAESGAAVRRHGAGGYVR